jgi:NMD protein affecting ribosome stability and mRNA decay
MTLKLELEESKPEDLETITCPNCFRLTGDLVKLPCKDPCNTPAAIGMHHCPDCGMMIMAGLPHFDVCYDCYKELTGEVYTQ